MTVTITLRDERGNLIDSLRYVTTAIPAADRKSASNILRTLLKGQA